MPQTVPTLTVVVGSTRPGRVGLPVAQWFTRSAEADGGFRVVVADLALIDLPLLDEPNHPRPQQYLYEHNEGLERATARRLTPSSS